MPDAVSPTPAPSSFLDTTGPARGASAPPEEARRAATPPEEARRAAALMAVSAGQIEDLEPLAGGMTNRSYRFRLGGAAYVLRLPGPGTTVAGSPTTSAGGRDGKPPPGIGTEGGFAARGARAWDGKRPLGIGLEGLPGACGAAAPGAPAQDPVDRDNERAVYRALEATGLTERLVAMDQAGARVTVFYEGARAPDPRQPADLATAMGVARRLHAMGLKTGPRFALDQQVHRYERLCANLPPPPYPHLDRQRARARELASRLSQKHTTEVLCHCDMVADNILILPTGRALLIDWEYAALADPLIDVAGLCMGSFLERPQAAEALRVYLRREPLPDESARLALHLAVAGYAWALWAHWQAQTRPGARDAAAYAAYGAATYRFALEYSGLVA